MAHPLKTLFLLLRPEQRKKLFGLQALVILMSIAEIASVFAIGPFMALIGNLDQLTGSGLIAEIYTYTGFKEERHFLFLVGGLVILILFFSSIISTFTLWTLAMYGAKIGADLGNRLFSYYINQPWLFHADGNSSLLINKITVETNRVTGSIILQFMYMNAKVVLALLLSVTIFVFNPQVALAGTIIFSISYFLIFKLVQKTLTKNGLTISRENAIRFKLMSEGFGGIKDILLLGRQNLFNQQFQDASNKFYYAWGNSQVLASVPRYFMELIAFSSAILLVMYLLIFSEGSMLAILPIISIYALAGFKLLPAFQQIYFSISTIQGNLASLANIQVDLKAAMSESSSSYLSALPDHATPKLPVLSSIELANINFKYPNSEQLTLSNLTIEFPVNKVLGLVGPSGSGKSTIIDLLMGLIEPDQGSLLIDGSNLEPFQKRAWQNNLGFVSQAIFLADSSIRENIAFGVPAELICEESVVSAIKLANLEEVVDSLPAGLNTLVGERGVQLSGGQRQRLGIARALYNDANILIFDEATSSLDGITEKLIMEAINSFAGTKTIILIAHRLSTVKECDMIYFIDGGRVIDSGNYLSLMKSNARFQQMSENS